MMSVRNQVYDQVYEMTLDLIRDEVASDVRIEIHNKRKLAMLGDPPQFSIVSRLKMLITDDVRGLK